MKNTYLKYTLIFFLLCSIIYLAKSQSISNYSFTATSGTFTALSGSNAPTFSGGSTNDGWYNSIPIGFEFWFMGTRYDNVGASTNGWLTFGFGSTSITTAVAANSFSSNTVPRPFVAPLWDDLDFTQSFGVFSYKTTGTAPNRVFTAEWLNAEWGWSANDSVISFQIKLYETSGKIDFIYRQEISSVASGSASIGIEGVSTFQSLNGTGTAPSSSTSTNTTNLSTKPATGQVYSFTPPTPAAPTSLSFTSVTQNSMVVNWTDNATNEVGYVIYISTDSINYTFQTQLAANTTSASMLSLSPTTKYYYKVYAVTEGGLSNVLMGNQTTLTGTLSGVITIPGNYATITAAIAALQTSGFSNSVVLELQSSYTSSGETFPIYIPNNLGTLPTKTITLRPALGVSSVAITSSNSNAIIIFNGCKYFKIDGRPGGLGTTIALTINNDYSSTSGNGTSISFYNDACCDTIRYCNITGNVPSYYYGVVYFGGTTATSGNDSNDIEYCTIHAGSIANPNILIYATGTPGKESNSNTIANNNLYDFSPNIYFQSAQGININSYCTDFRITGNHIFQTQSLTASVAWGMYGIYFYNTAGYISISNNYIGGSAPYCASSAWVLGSVSTANVIYPLYIYSSSTLASTISGNTIANYLLATNSSGTNFTGIYAGGLCTINGNTIGSSIGTGSITIVSEYAGTASAYAINIDGTSSNSIISNNAIGSFNVGGSLPAHAVSFYGISVAGINNTISNNLIGSLTTINSIIASNNSTNAQMMYAIYVNNITGTSLLSGNTVSNLTNVSASGSGGIVGIYIIAANTATCTISGNLIQNLATSSTSTSPIVGVSVTTNPYSLVCNVSQNIVQNLYLNNASASGTLYGISFSADPYQSATNVISKNFVHSFYTSSSSNTARLVGINSILGYCNIQNNMIQLGINPDGTSLTAPCIVYGIMTSYVNTMLWQNSVYIGGTGALVGAGISACYYRNASGTDYIYNNIFYNARTNASTGGNHYTVYFLSTSGLTCNYNLYYTGVPLACMINANGTTYTNFATYKSATGYDANSAIADPRFVNITGNSASVNLHINSAYATPIESFGNSTYTATDDYDGQTRSLFTPVDVGADAGNFTALTLPVKWMSFDGKLSDKNSVVLNWETASEINNNYFEVERALDNGQWLIVGKVKGNGTTNSVSSYEFIDASAVIDMTKVVYYRLKQVDMDGKFEYSNTIAILLNEIKDAIIIAPNPFTDKFELLLPEDFNNEVLTIGIKDIQGRSVFTKTYSLEKNQSKIAVETNTLNSGIYFVNFTTKNGVGKYQKLIKQ